MLWRFWAKKTKQIQSHVNMYNVSSLRVAYEYWFTCILLWLRCMSIHVNKYMRNTHVRILDMIQLHCAMLAKLLTYFSTANPNISI